MSNAQTIDWTSAGFDFLDFGCSDGANIRFVKETWPLLSECGIDIDPRKIKSALENSHNVIMYNIHDLPNNKITRFVTMSHFLEHLNSVSDARKMIIKAINISKDFVLIRQPWFDADGLLLQHGLKFYWSHWRGHQNRMSVLDFYVILSSELAAGRVQSFQIYGRGPIKSSADSCFIPLEAPIDQHHYDAAKHGTKPTTIEFSIPVYKEVVAVIKISPDELSDEMLKKLDRLTCLYSSERS
jgi:hypothetical protein